MACAFQEDRCSLSCMRYGNHCSNHGGEAAYDAAFGVLIPSIPLLAEKVWRALRGLIQ